jgi:hypothetical protein
MAKQTINIGASPNDGTGTPLRTAFDYTNQNFTELYTATGPSGNNIVVPGNATITGDLTVDTSTLKVDSTNNRVGIRTASPAEPLTVDNSSGVTTGAIRIYAIDQSHSRLAIQNGNGQAYHLVAGNPGASNAGFALYDNTAAATRLYVDNTGVQTWQNVGGVAGTAMTLNANGLGIGVTPSAWGNNNKVVQVGQAGSIYGRANLGYYGSKFNLYNDNTNDIAITSNWVGEYRFELLNGSHVWLNKSTTGTLGVAQTLTQAMTLDASGSLLLACTSSPTGSTSGFYFDATHYAYFSRSAGETLNLNRYTSTGATAKFRYAGTEVGDISVTGAGTTYNSTSDYRLKEAVAPLSGGLARVNALKPSIYNWKSNGSTGEGFLAHELAEVVPAAVTGEKDAVNEDGSIKAQSIDMSRVVPILVAAIQELTARVQTLEAK